MISMNSGIVKNHKRIFTYTEREYIKKVDHLLRGNTLRSGETLIMVLAVNHIEDVVPCGSLGGDTYLLSGQLPTVGNVSFGTDVALVSTVEGYISLPSLTFSSFAE
jgi:hypothetical protein